MNKCHLLTNNQYGQREEIPCDDLLSGLVTYGQRIEHERAALREATPTEFGNAYFFIAIYDGGRQVSWTVRFLHDGGEWEETTSWRFNGENELISSSGRYRADEIHESLGDLADLMGQPDISPGDMKTYRAAYEALEEECAKLSNRPYPPVAGD